MHRRSRRKQGRFVPEFYDDDELDELHGLKKPESEEQGEELEELRGEDDGE